MTIIDDLPATDAMNYAETIGANLSVLANKCDDDPMVRDNTAHVYMTVHPDNLVSYTAPFTTVFNAPGVTPVVPVFPNRRRRGSHGVLDPATVNQLTAAGVDVTALTGTFDEDLLCDGAHTGVVTWPAAPQTHSAHHARTACEHADNAECWRECAAVVLASAERFMEATDPASPGSYVAAPMLRVAPLGVSAVEVAEFTRSLAAIVTDVVMFAPSPIGTQG